MPEQRALLHQHMLFCSPCGLARALCRSWREGVIWLGGIPTYFAAPTSKLQFA